MPNKQQIKKSVVDEVKKFSVIVGYVWIAVSIFELHKWMVLREHHLTHELGFKLGVGLINAVVLGKVILIAEDLHVAERLRYKALVQPIVYKSAVFSIVLIFFQIVEGIILGRIHGRTIAQSIPPLGGGGFEGIFLWGVVCFVLLIPFFAFRELSRVIGKDELISLIFRSGTKPATVQSAVQQEKGRVA